MVGSASTLCPGARAAHRLAWVPAPVLLTYAPVARAGEREEAFEGLGREADTNADVARLQVSEGRGTRQIAWCTLDGLPWNPCSECFERLLSFA